MSLQGVTEFAFEFGDRLWLHTVFSVPVHKGRINQALAGSGLGNAACPFLPRGSQFCFDWLSTR